ncbi:multicopper oxidase domain-containing protein [Effusibacillus pohliae]|uniref:multicopper oxidase domain-containing protein n=1 Tax=Effusibacillus pohliae TaxID=232270 RepID=UPI00037530EB|nr:multicopper oxidase domain-containing protein [Effusibacillus pohliae]
MKRLGIGLMLGLCGFLVAGCSDDAKPAVNNTANKQEKVFHLYAGDAMQELAPGKTLYSWGFGLWDEQNNKPASPPTIPGPELRVREGDHVKVVFHNKQKEPHTIHFHGIDNSFNGDGTPGVSQEEVKTDGTFTYEFDATKAGTYFYHCHVEPDRHPEMGLYGAFIVEPKEQKAKYDGEFVLLLGERDPLLSVAEGTEAGKYVGTAAEHEKLDGEYDTADRHPKFFTINGKMDHEIPPLQVKKGGKYLIRLINAGNDVHAIHTHGHHFQVIASDGRDIAQPETKDTVTIGPGERYDLVLTADNPGAWPLHCHIGPHGTHGMHTFIVYEGFEDKMHGHALHQLDSIMHELAEIKQNLHDEQYDQLKAELGELSANFNKTKGALATKDQALANGIEATGAEIAKALTAAPDQKRLETLVNQLEEQLNKAQEILME